MTSGHQAQDHEGLLPQHAALLAASGIAAPLVRERGYRSIIIKADLRSLGFGESQLRVPALLIPIWGVSGEILTYQIRPDAPRIQNGKPLKYETPAGTRMVLDVPRRARPWLGDPKKPFFVTEGSRKADSAVSRDLCCVALLGVWNWRGTNTRGGKVALPDWESVALNGRLIYIVFDSDVMQKAGVHAALARLKEFLESRGAHVFVIYLPPGPDGAKVGLDDFFVAGHTVEDLLGLALSELRVPTDSDSAQLAHAEREARAETAGSTAVAREENAEAGPYRVEDGRIVREKQTQHGTITDPLCNFTATVTEEVVLDDGVESTRAFILGGRLDSGETLPGVRVPASRFTTMNWVTESWGLRAVVRAGQATRDYLREAIQRLSPKARERRVFTHTGWREIAGEWVFLTASGAVGRDDFEVDLGSELPRYRLPREAQNPVEAMRMSLKLLRVAPFRVTVPLWAAVFRAPLASAYPADLSLWIEGQTGSLKSTLAAIFLSHFGDFDRLHLPGVWSSTANQLERRAFILKDALFVVDDYVPSAMDVREQGAKVARLIRAQGNLSGRGRLRADLTDRPAFPPRGLIVSTGEQHPPGQSLLARMVLVELERADVNLIVLTEAQENAARLPHAMAGYLRWLAPQMPTLPGLLSQTFAGARARATADGEHLRVPEALAHLWLGLHSGLTCAEEISACSRAEAEQLRAEGWVALLALGRAQGRLVEEERPTRRFLAVLLTLVTQRRAVLLPKEEDGKGIRAGMDLLGWQDDEALYLLPEAAFQAVARFCRESGELFPIRQERLKKDLAKEGLMECDPGRYTRTVKIAGRTRRVLSLKRAGVETLLGETFPSPVVTEVTGFGG